MKVVFIKRSGKGEAEYDPETETYSWSYEGDDPEIKGILSTLDSGKHYSEMVTDIPDSTDRDELVVNESYERLPWDEQIEALAKSLERADAEILYLGE